MDAHARVANGGARNRISPEFRCGLSAINDAEYSVKNSGTGFTTRLIVRVARATVTRSHVFSSLLRLAAARGGFRPRPGTAEHARSSRAFHERRPFARRPDQQLGSGPECPGT